MSKTDFVTVTSATEKILKAVRPASVIQMKSAESTGCIIARNLRAYFDAPPFHQSAMDGYAFRFADFAGSRQLNVNGESAAGKNYTGRIRAGEAVRIFTGAAVPQGADTVIMQEKTRLEGNRITLLDEQLQQGVNIRKQGSHFRKGSVAAAKGTLINTGAIGYLGALGIDNVPVYKRPSATLIITGEELVSPGKVLKPGQIYESNGVCLRAALKQDGIHEIKTVRVKDNPEATSRAFRNAMKQSDFIIFSGGISVGDYDYVRPILQREKVKTIFYKVQQKPGKPLYFGIKDKRYIFGLPGNPASVLTCYYEYVRPAIRKNMGYPQPLPIALTLPVTVDIRKKPGLTHFLKAVTDFHTVTPLPGQESYVMTPFVKANCFIIVPPEITFAEKGSPVTVHLF